jgi:RNA polymerase subunit RPABC4/transcription elongation factor Spt4
MYEEYEDSDDCTVACPHCGKDIYDDADQCPYCSMNISAADFKKPWPAWVMILIVLTIIGFVLAAIRF